jgi:FMNH2-dependent dimethyl sulfone monooxygenase
LKLGIWTPLPHAVPPEPRLDAAIRQSQAPATTPYADEALALARDVVTAGERLGFDITLIAERLLGPDLEAWMLGTTLAALAPRIHVMIAVHPGLWAPQIVAKMGASLDRITGGRFHLNVVPGWWEAEHRMFGGDWATDSDERYGRMQEFVAVVKGLWTQERFTFQGRHFQLEDASAPPLPVQQPYPPIYAASRSEGGMEVIARECDWWFLPHGAGYRDFDASRRMIETARDGMVARAARYQRALQYGLSVHVICRRTHEEAIAAAERLEEHGKTNRIAQIAAMALGAGLVGTYDEVAERMLTYHTLGVELFLIHFSPMLEEMERFGAEVVPRLRAALDPARAAAPLLVGSREAASPAVPADEAIGGIRSRQEVG